MSKMLSSLTNREKRLLTITILVVTTAAVMGSVYKGYMHLRDLDRRIANSEQELLNLREQTLQSRSVEMAFRQVVSERSTALTKEEIHDSLRREIYRLALKNPDLPETEQKNPNRGKNLVVIPGLREGVLREKGEGYREYQIQFRVPSCNMLQALAFLRRLEESKLLLRVDSFEMARPHSSTKISLNIEITRTILSEFDIASPDESSPDWNAASNTETRMPNGRPIL